MSEQQQEKHTAGAFDVRNVIAALIGAYGLVLVVMAFAGDAAEEADRTGGLDANLWAGIGMLVFAAAFALWARLRPVVVDPPRDTDDGA
ncbi:hypothetical protein [Klenkia taihuensis]|uniref:Uncharacterized protein n=1 Tax=Klenkia taihuensis TaxID=1225127 RepID=A0A1I1KLW9_9ACTN|nr:hypothetical protein [Klenkia taihuensis]GHE10208.1 hypothetical protein GCM10011381_18180 [Klenkia taihuensis]SFC61779.1 hypothetical protein SAMN05661030_1466 [Klenkia taihuensis]